MGARFFWALAAVTFVTVLGLVTAKGLSAQGRTVWSGIYTEQQAARGSVVFAARCQECHGAELGGGRGPSLVGDRFVNAFEADTVNRLFRTASQRMPQNAPGSLTADEYLHVLAFILQSNSYPAGTEPLTSDPAVLAGIKFVRKDGPVTAPNFSLVRTVGCLSAGASGDWVITGASEPLVTKDSAPSAGADLEAAAATPPGPHTFKLLSVLDPLDGHKGHKMEAKGLLIRTATDARINLTSLQMVGSACGG